MPLDLEAVEARVDAATPGPWYAVHTDDTAYMNAHYVGTQDRGAFHDNVVGMDGSRAGETVAITLLQAPDLAAHDGEQWRENTDFIAHARQDVPALIAEVRRLRTEMDTALALAEERRIRLMLVGEDPAPEGWWYFTGKALNGEVRHGLQWVHDVFVLSVDSRHDVRVSDFDGTSRRCSHPSATAAWAHAQTLRAHIEKHGTLPAEVRDG